jgi:hypothetical protein
MHSDSSRDQTRVRSPSQSSPKLEYILLIGRLAKFTELDLPASSPNRFRYFIDCTCVHAYVYLCICKTLLIRYHSVFAKSVITCCYVSWIIITIFQNRLYLRLNIWSIIQPFFLRFLLWCQLAWLGRNWVMWNRCVFFCSPIMELKCLLVLQKCACLAVEICLADDPGQRIQRYCWNADIRASFSRILSPVLSSDMLE